MLINIKSISKDLGATLTVSFIEMLPQLKIASDTLEFKSPVNVDIKATNTGSNFIVNATIQAQLELICSRCLKPFDFNISTTMLEGYCRASDVKEAEEDGLDVDELIVFNGDEIDIKNEVIDSIVMDLPMKPVCYDNCHGLCTICGQNLNDHKCTCEVDNIDPRLEILKKLKF